jgi:hypothetical protein
MEMRARLLKGATAVLYFGPLLAGLGGYGWSLVPTFVAIFVLWQMIVRPHHWPTSLADLKKSDLWVGIAAQIAVQMLLVIVFFGIGRGIGGAAGTLPLYSPMVPLSLSFLSIPLCRLLWNPWKGDSFDAIEAANAPDAVEGVDPEAEQTATAGRLLQPLQDMAGRVSEAEALRHLQAMAKHVPLVHLHEALVGRNARPDASHAIQMALVVLATDPAMMDRLDEAAPTRALQALPEDDAMLGLFAKRFADAVATDSDLALHIPADALLDARASRIGGEGGSALTALSRLRSGTAAAA